MPAKRKYPATLAPTSLASTRSRRFLSARQTDTEPDFETQSQNNRDSLDGQTTKAVKTDRFAEEVEVEDNLDLPTASKKPRNNETPGLSQIQFQLESTSITSSNPSSTGIVLGMKRLGIDNPDGTKDGVKRPRLSPRTPQPQTEHSPQDKEKEADITSTSEAAPTAAHTLTQPSLPSLPEPEVHQGPEDSTDNDIPELVRSRPYSGPRKPRTQLAQHLPPLWNLSDIFKSLTNRAIELNLDDVLSHLGDRRLRVVTVCSGTESPLLALEMVRENLHKYFNRTLNFQHLFSAEIVPFKQAYIERNFHPRLLFRDVTELKGRVAQTAYGSLEKIPKNVDILIAGFSCVDFSGLNNHRKTLDEEGESGGTFWGIVRYARAYRPRLVILENVKTAPWKKIAQHWNDIGYFAIHADVDTKAYYLPQTRERGYMFCVDKKSIAENGLAEEDMQQWTEVLKRFKRPASSPAGMFLIDADDRRLEQIEKDMAAKIASSASAAKATVNWDRYQVRHQSYRLNQGLGYRRPVSKSQDDGTCRMPDFAWQTWVKSLPERVWDTIDVNFLRKLVEGYDMNYKEYSYLSIKFWFSPARMLANSIDYRRCLELSQGIDREMDSRAFGIVGCITPTGLPFMTTRGGPLCGLESLALQGLPLDRLLLTQESQRELQDLAGNAMSSTVVGAAILSALIVGHRALKKGNSLQESDFRAPKRKAIIPQGENNLVESSMHLDAATVVNMSKLQDQATSSARYCICERQTSTRAVILKCTHCSHTACSECSGNPQHAYERWTDLVRTSPLDFISSLRAVLPARLVVNGITHGSYAKLRFGSSIAPTIWAEFLDAVFRAVGDELRLLDIKRSESWTVLYEGKSSVLKLVVQVKSITWLLFAKPRESDPALCLIREVLSKPIARMVVPQSGSILEGNWEICAPLSSSCSLGLSGSGSRIQSYESKCGLELERFRDSLTWTHITVEGADEEVNDLEIDVRGTYELLQDCGTANACLHKKAASVGEPAVYLFLDPTKLGEPKSDSFVFAFDHTRNPGYECRLSIAEVSHVWRSSNATEKTDTTAVYYKKWIACPTVSLASYAGDSESPIRCYNLQPASSIPLIDEGCHNANMTILAFIAPTAVIDAPRITAEWGVTDPVDSPQVLRKYVWLLQKAAAYSGFREWNVVTEAKVQGPCMVCVPPKPGIKWGRDARGRIKAYEDPYSAARYERDIKSRPPPFLIFQRTNKQGLAELHVTLNIQTLLHQAHGRLSSPNVASFHWRLIPNSYNTKELSFPAFNLRSNRSDPLSTQPPGFIVELRPEQRRSLSWMIEQEDENIEPFIEEETEEAILESLMWRAEGKVTVPKTVRGGILADDVGYGKTAIVLGLIDKLYNMANVDFSVPLNADGFIPSRATLIVVPTIMVQQWRSEIVKFLGSKYNVLVFPSAAALKKVSIRDIRKCDIVLVSWAVFSTSSYYQRFKQFAGAPEVPLKAGRNFDDWFSHAHGLMKRHVRVLAEQGPRAFQDGLKNRRAQTKDTQEEYRYVPSKRLRGKKYTLAKLNKDCETKSSSVSYAEVSSAEEDSDEAGDENISGSLEAKVESLLRRVTPQFSKAKEEEESNGEQVADYKSAKPWDDWKEFNISRNSRSKQPWDAVKGIPLHAFAFNRLIIDEFTYASIDRLNQLLTLQARPRWVLSGTPPLNDFADVNTIAPFLGVHLGIDDDDTNPQNRRLKAIRNQRSDAETFQSFRAPRSEAWHRRRYGVAQNFLDRYARRNIAEIDEIPSTEHIVLVRQSPAEKAIYLELYKQLMTYNRQLRRSSSRGGFGSDQAERLDEIIASSSTTEEALIKRCTSLALQGRWDADGKPEAATCVSLIETREEQLEKLKNDLKSKLKLAAWVYCACNRSHEKFDKFVQSVARHDFGDIAVTGEVYPLLNTAIHTSRNEDWKLFFANPDSKVQENEEDDKENIEDTEDTDATAEKPTAKAKTVVPLPTKPTQMREFELVLREVTTTIRNLLVEWVLRTRALRFLKIVRQMQTNSADVPSCDRCQNQPDLLAKVNILGSCGHAICLTCTQQTIEKEECEVEGCRGSGKRFNIINAMILGCDTDNLNSPVADIDKSSEYGGTKMDVLLDILGHQIPKHERALLFIQFPDLMDIASKALDSARITHTTISSADRNASLKIEKFQKEGFGDRKVLLLNLGSEMAAGLNLQCANHIVFLSPFFAQTQYDYDSTMTQAIGRCRRYGQTNHVHVYHLLAKMTIDVNIFQERRGKVLVEREGEPVLVDPEEALESEAITCQGPEMLVDNAF